MRNLTAEFTPFVLARGLAMAGGRCSFGTVVVALLAATVGGGCATANHEQTGALVGAGFGGLMGGIIGNHTGHAAGGAVIGAATGAVAGGLIGDAEDAREERDAARARLQAMQDGQPRLTNVDLIRMAKSGIADDVIITAMQTQGGRFQLTPEALIELKSHGVSDQVIRAVQEAGRKPSSRVLADGTVVIAGPAPDVVGFRDPPQSTVRHVGVHVGPGRPHRHFHRGRHWHSL